MNAATPAILTIVSPYACSALKFGWCASPMRMAQYSARLHHPCLIRWLCLAPPLPAPDSGYAGSCGKDSRGWSDGEGRGYWSG